MSILINDSEMLWHNDGHKLFLQINKSELEIVDVYCPNTGGGDCRHERYGCIVEFFVTRFGLDCNVGVCPAKESLTICWSLVGDKYDVEAAQLWFVPLEDDMFHAWLITKTNQDKEDLDTRGLD